MIDVFVSVILVLVVVGLIVWAIQTLLPLPPEFKNGIRVVAIVFVAIYCLAAVLSLLGYWHGFPLLIHR
jgi:hypothetical protein